jgi:hypothetical protein
MVMLLLMTTQLQLGVGAQESWVTKVILLLALLLLGVGAQEL